MSHAAIAAALALDDVAAGERLVAFSLASYANREQRAFPGTAAAAARAGLSHSQYLAARDALVTRGLVCLESTGGGRGNSPVIRLAFAKAGPWSDREVNPAVFEAVLARSRVRGSARLLIAALAALADEGLGVADVTTEELRTAAGLADSTYRRARAALLASGEVTLGCAGGGRAKTNRWVLRDPRTEDAPAPAPAARRVATPHGARPLIATVRQHAAVAEEGARSGADDTWGNRPGSSGVWPVKPAQDRRVSLPKGLGLSGVSPENPGHSRTVSAETPPQTPLETPPPNARAGSEPQNPRTIPPSPPDGGSHPSHVSIVEHFLTESGRRRKRTVVVDLDELRSRFRDPDSADRQAWEQIRTALRHVVGDAIFEIWLEDLELRAADQGDVLLVAGRAATRGWVASRFGQLLNHTAGGLGRRLRLVDEGELRLLDAISLAPSGETGAPRLRSSSTDHKEAV